MVKSNANGLCKIMAGDETLAFIILCCQGLITPNSQKVTKHTDDYYGQHAPLYNKMYTRIAPYIVGMLLGYVLHKTDCRVKLPKVFVVVGWIVAIVIGLSVVYGPYEYYHDSKQASLATSIIYIGVNRFSWGVALAWVIFACATGYGGLVNDLLSWKAWAPLGRLTYCAYLLHPIVMFTYIERRSTLLHYSDLNMVFLFFSFLVASYSAAYLVSMMVEAPLLGLEKVVFKKR